MTDRCPTCKRRYNRSHQQNARLWLLYHMAAEKLRPDGVEYSAETFHLYYKSRFLGSVEHRLPNGSVTSVLNSTADLDVAEFNDYMTKVEADLAERGVYLEEAFST
jgi:hypothetical protein